MLPQEFIDEVRPLLGGELDAFLRAFRSYRVAPVALKAVLTETNAGWDSVRLHEELCRERDALSRGGKAHRE